MQKLGLILLLLAPAAFAQERAPNHLLGEDSPYLIQHLYNPVDWYPWGDEALQKARDEDKLIFLSVGYSACHWCHVMEEESFENDAIAAYLNEHYVSIKVDRERRPDLDEQFLLATQALTGSGGWPNSVFLTPGGDPFHAGTYFPPAEFQAVLRQVVDLRLREPETIEIEGQRLTEMLTNYLTRKAEAQELTPELINEFALSVLPDVDFFYGGIGVTSKFPREPLFLFLLDQAERTGNTELLEAVTTMLDGMIIGGIHDQVGGGFHRYAVDPQWHVPHFEKMLYTQALTGRLLVRAWQATGKPAYRRAAERLFTYVLRDMRDDKGGFFAAQDADSNNADGEYLEGAFYTWTPADLNSLTQSASFLADTFQITQDGELDGANVLNMPDFADVLADSEGLDEGGFYARLDPLLEQMRLTRAARAAPFADEKIVAAWNGVMIATLAEAAHTFDEPGYFNLAEQAAVFILENMKSDDGFFRIFFDSNAHVDGQLSDYASLGLAFVALHDYSPDPAKQLFWLQQAQELADAIRAKFGAAGDGFRMTAKQDGISTIIPVEDGEIASGNAMALDLFARLAKRSENPELTLEATRLAAALSGHAAEIPRQRAAILTASQDLQFGEIGPVRYVANGAVRVEMDINRNAGLVELNIDVADGWHINAHEPLEDFYIPMELTIADSPIAPADYPDPTIKTLGFNSKPLALYEGQISLSGPIETGQISLTLQACSDEICLQPAELVFQIW
ncbi:MAG: DUF255 domain-containing protein [Paracoccaceae bacterium]